MSNALDSIETRCAAHAPVAVGGSFAAGTVFGDWRLTAFIGRGGSGEVYCAEHVTLGTSAAVKVLVREEDRARKRFEREAKLLAELKSESFPRFYGYGDANGVLYIAMELLEPGDMPSGDKAVAKFMLKVCDAVVELHARGLVHRDIKPGNILWRSATEPVLADLGLVKAADDATNATLNPQLLTLNSQLSTSHGAGTPGYGAPEQMERGEVSFAADVHALGVLADRCFGGNPPRAWARIIERATSSIPDRRYSSVQSFARAIRCRHLVRYLIGLMVIFLAMIAVSNIDSRYMDFDDETEATVVRPIKREYRRQKNGSLKLSSIIQLDGGTAVLAEPIVLEAGKEYQISGPGTLDANLFCPTTTIVRLKNCVLLNRTKQLYPKNGIQYRLENGVYLNFINIREKPSMLDISDFTGLYDGAYNKVRFGGPETVRELMEIEGNSPACSATMDSF